MLRFDPCFKRIMSGLNRSEKCWYGFVYNEVGEFGSEREMH